LARKEATVDYAKRAADMVITAPSIMGNRRGWLKVPGTDRGGVAFDVGERHVDLAVADVRAMLAAELQAAHAAGVAERDAEVATLRQIISDAAREVGAQVSPECSLEFMALLPREVAMAIRRAEKTANDAGVAEERARWVQVATAARSALGKYAHDTGYGFFFGGDPRRFSPDEESSTSEEIAAWEAACAEAEADEKARDLASPCGLEIVEHEGRNVPAFVDRAPFGLGTYECGDEEAAAACEAITALLGDGLIAGATESNEGGR